MVSSVSSEAVRPHRYLVQRGIVAVLALTLPVFAVTYWFTVPVGAWGVTSIALVLVLAGGCLGVLWSFRVWIEIDEDGIALHRPLWRVRRIRNRDVGILRLIELYQANTLDTEAHLYVIANDSRPLLRMRRRFWPEEAMDRVSGAFDAPLRIDQQPLTLGELRHRNPELLTRIQRLVTPAR